MASTSNVEQNVSDANVTMGPDRGSKRPRDSSSNGGHRIPTSSSAASQLPQDLVDLIAECSADLCDPYAVLRLRAVNNSWATAAKNALALAKLSEPDSCLCWREWNPVFQRMVPVFRRDCNEVKVRLRSRADCSVFEKALPRVHSTEADSHRFDRRPCTLTLQPWSRLRSLDLSGSQAEGVNNDTMQSLARTLPPTFCSLHLSCCVGVTDVNAFEHHALTDLNISGTCRVNSEGMCRLLYIRKLNVDGNRGVPSINRPILGRLTELILDVSIVDQHLERLPCVKKATFTGVKDWYVYYWWVSRMPVLTDLEIEADHPLGWPELLDAPPHLVKVRLLGKSPRYPVRRLRLMRCAAIVDLTIFAATLTELDVSHDPEEADFYLPTSLEHDSLSGLLALTTLRKSWNHHITALTPVADTLTALHAGGTCAITNETLAELRHLRFLDLSDNTSVTTIAPLMETLKHLRGAQNIPPSEIEEARRHLVHVEQ